MSYEEYCQKIKIINNQSVSFEVDEGDVYMTFEDAFTDKQ